MTNEEKITAEFIRKFQKGGKFSEMAWFLESALSQQKEEIEGLKKGIQELEMEKMEQNILKDRHCGVSQWMNYGKKMKYWKHFVDL